MPTEVTTDSSPQDDNEKPDEEALGSAQPQLTTEDESDADVESDPEPWPRRHGR
jgi:hypothetical protein